MADRVLVMAENIASTTGAFYPPGQGQFICTVTATWGGGTVTLQVLAADGTTWISIPDAASTADNTFRVFLSGKDQIRVLIATSTAVYFDIKHITWE